MQATTACLALVTCLYEFKGIIVHGLKINYRETFAVFLYNVGMRFGVFENLCTEPTLDEFNQLGPGRCADSRACGRERDDEFPALVHDTQRPDAAVERFVFGL